MGAKLSKNAKHLTLKAGQAAPLHRFVTLTVLVRVFIPTEHLALQAPQAVHTPTYSKAHIHVFKH